MGIQWDIFYGDSSEPVMESVIERMERQQLEVMERLERYDRRLRPKGVPKLERLVDLWVSQSERKNRKR